MSYYFENLMVGCDPEVMLWKGKNPVSAQGIIPGTKEKPKAMDGLPKGFFILADNVTCEFNVPPAATKEAFVNNISLALTYVKRRAKARGLRCTTDAAVYFPETELQSEGAQQFGCDADFDFWKMDSNPNPEPPPALRTAAGHVHVGWDNPTLEERVLLGRMFDLFLTVPSLLVTKPNQRRSLYGKAGACRFKPYGIECRSIESFWIANARWCKSVYSRVELITQQLINHASTWDKDLMVYGQQIVDTINTHSTENAVYLMNLFDIEPFYVPEAKSA